MKENISPLFIKYEDLVTCVHDVIESIRRARSRVEEDPHKNVIDPFSATFAAIYHRQRMSDWLDGEKQRQSQKSWQNAIGNFHQRVLGKIDGWEDLGVGNVADLVNHDKKIIAEVKNKYNTTKGSDKVRIYDMLSGMLAQPEFRGYTAYYVEVIPKAAKKYDTPFTPPDNTTKGRRVENPVIRVIDGYSFYERATGIEDALSVLYAALPEIIAHEIEGVDPAMNLEPMFLELFNRAYGVDTDED
jgi:hypothetical protein